MRRPLIRWRFRGILALFTTLAVAHLYGAVAQAETILIQNRADAPVRLRVDVDATPGEFQTLAPGKTLAATATTTASLLLEGETEPRPLELESLYHLDRQDGKWRLQRHQPEPTPLKVTIPVKVCYDEDSREAPMRWQTRLRSRFQEASAIFEANFGIRFEIIAFEEWSSDNKAADLDNALKDFESKVKPDKARLVVGFTSQFLPQPGTTHFGAGAKPFQSHILIKEWQARTTETARLEALVHEIGHFLGAVHSNDPSSVMRPMLRDGLEVRASHRVGFDPVNVVLLYAVVEDMAERPDPRSLKDLSPKARAVVEEAYRGMAQVLSGDASVATGLGELGVATAAPAVAPAPKMAPAKSTEKPKAVKAKRKAPTTAPAKPAPEEPAVVATQKSAAPTRKPAPPVDSLAGATRQVIAAVARVADENRLRPPVSQDPNVPTRKTGDALTDDYLRAAAEAAAELPREHAAKAFLLGIAIALDRSNLLVDHPLTSVIFEPVESDEERRERLTALGFPTVRGRRDLTQHFVVSAGLTALVGPALAERAGIEKETADAKDVGGTGFSFADLAADAAGIEFATWILSRPSVDPNAVAKLKVNDLVGDLAGLDEGLSWEAMLARYGSTLDERFRRKMSDIKRDVKTRLDKALGP